MSRVCYFSAWPWKQILRAEVSGGDTLIAGHNDLSHCNRCFHSVSGWSRGPLHGAGSCNVNTPHRFVWLYLCNLPMSHIFLHFHQNVLTHPGHVNDPTSYCILWTNRLFLCMLYAVVRLSKSYFRMDEAPRTQAASHKKSPRQSSCRVAPAAPSCRHSLGGAACVPRGAVPLCCIVCVVYDLLMLSFLSVMSITVTLDWFQYKKCYY